MKPALIFDIETGALPLETIKSLGILPTFKAPANYKDPEKIKSKEAEHEQEVMERAALDPTISKVLAIGYVNSDGTVDTVTGNETDLLSDFWARIKRLVEKQHKLIGFNICGFDLPFLIRRSWINGVPVSNALRRGRYWNDHYIIDLADVWKLGVYNDNISLDRLSKVLGIGQKSGSGKDFHKMLEENPAKALEYLRTDLELTAKLAQRLHVIDETPHPQEDFR
jgi:DNA polymerase elongation subunit (family B)